MMQFKIERNVMSYGVDFTGHAADIFDQPMRGFFAFVGSAVKPVFFKHWRHNTTLA
jgi:hypothetical protein